MNARINDILKYGVIEESHSEWSAPIVIVKKKDGTLQLCADYRQLNGISMMDAYPMPQIDQRLMDSVIQVMQDYAADYLDDLIILANAGLTTLNTYQQ